MSWLSNFFRSDKGQAFAFLIIKAAKIFLGNVANELYRLCQKHVMSIEAQYPNKPGIEKFEMVRKAVLAELQGISIPLYLVNLMIEAAVTVIKERKIA